MLYDVIELVGFHLDFSVAEPGEHNVGIRHPILFILGFNSQNLGVSVGITILKTMASDVFDVFNSQNHANSLSSRAVSLTQYGPLPHPPCQPAPLMMPCQRRHF